MRGMSPVVGLGRPGEALGVGRILTNEKDWRAAATSLIDRAVYIFCIPSGRAGTLWEIDHILEHHLLARTVFIMPPLPGDIGLEDDWANLIVEMKKRGLTFPKYKNNGMLFYITSATSVATRPFQLASPGSIRRGVKELVYAANEADLKQQFETVARSITDALHQFRVPLLIIGALILLAYFASTWH